MVIIRRLARGVAILAVALAAGHLVQTLNSEEQALQTGEARPTQVIQVSAGPEAVPKPAPEAVPTPVILPEPTPLPVSTEVIQADVVPYMLAPRAPTAPSADDMLAAATPDVQLPRPVAPVLLPAELPAPTAALTAPVLPAPDASPALTEACPMTLDLMAEAQAMIGLTLVAPCHAGERVVLRHAGLVITAQTNATGSLFLALPAMATAAEVSVLFADQTSVASRIEVPELASMRRFAVQWIAEDAFQLQALENGATFGSPGHMSAENPGDGALRILGEAGVDRPMMAQVYTYPVDPQARVEVIVEAAVTETTCNRDLLGETITSVGGKVTVTDLTVATPPCDAVGDILVLKNLAPDVKIAVN